MSQSQSPKPPTPKEFYISYPLYEEVTFSEQQNEEGWQIRYFSGTIDAYCPSCNRHSIFSHAQRQISYEKDSWVGNNRFTVTLRCSRNEEHHLYFVFQVRGRKMQKIGQFPSLATLNLYDVGPYGAVLGKELFREFTRAIGLAAHGVGVGSFVYLRRIFEGLVEDAHKEAISTANWDAAEYQHARMSERILLLAPFLPKFLVENRSLYSILSKGVHELSEAECLTAYPAIKIGIEIILDAKLRALAERKKLDAAAKALRDLTHGAETK